jgi:hypothetical protein
MVQISEVKGNNARDSRTAAHTHIKGLGLRPDGIAERQSGGFVGQVAAREVSVCSNIPTEVTDFFSARLVEWLSTLSEHKRWLAEPYYWLEDLGLERLPSPWQSAKS